jgi:septal ring factor EnvC (AmiA/AmiB activator)
MAKLKSSLDKKKKQMAKLTRYHKNLLAKVYKEKNFAIKEITKIRRRNKELLERLSMDQGEFYTLKGKLKLPVMGEIVQNFGVLPKENRRVSLYSNGIKIAVKENKKVFSVAPGSVSFIGKLEGYGMTVVIDHGDRYYSVYSNLRLGNISKGDEISMNTMIGRVGGYPNESRNFLHFELRKFSEAIDPVPWIKKKYINLAKSQSNQTSM